MPYRSGFIAIIGRPNVGKSTLLNHLLGQKVSIISDKPQTTRNRIVGVKSLPEGQMVFFDTPGIHKARNKLNQRMVQTAIGSLQEVDLIFFMVEPDAEPGEGDRFIAEHLQQIETPKILIINKIDLVKRDRLIPLLSFYNEKTQFSEIFPISALTGENLDRLVPTALSYLPEGEPFFPEELVTDQPVRFLAAEIIREKVFRKTHEEIPYAVAVHIDTFKEDEEKNLITIQATLFVERDSQKGILIGQKGEMLKQIGKEAREELEALLGTRIFMELWVKVKRGWSKNDSFLTEMGY
ncbi:MAG: GTPase Era [Candidatus Manganitrophaceae bacterium]|nr:MAG: GTPase Era [Candidatus Manganitrophaceae bacterium]